MKKSERELKNELEQTKMKLQQTEDALIEKQLESALWKLFFRSLAKSPERANPC